MVRVGAREIFFSATGSGPAVVLLHGGGPGASGLSNYSRNLDALAQHFRVIAPDLPGYGRSTKHIDQSDPFGDLARAVGGLLDELGVASAHLVGNSYGGAAALRLAMDRPEKVDRMILMGPGGIGTTRALPTKGLRELLAYYGDSGPSRDKIARFIRGSSGTIWCSTRVRSPTRSSTNATAPASTPTWWRIRRCVVRPGRSPCARCGGWTSPATRACARSPIPRW
ncbi:alpha/beta fold hydrolase [Nocardia sp. NBC_01730]|uniref:alpha/beta fold hydrolase n=1 Tax=Nocardia sp. NBC_01730 TaxID=2975998 RepID=UPI003FA3B736